MNLLGLQIKHVILKICNIIASDTKVYPHHFSIIRVYRLFNVFRYGGEIQCLNYLLCDILKHSLYLRPPGDFYSKQILIHYASDHLSE